MGSHCSVCSLDHLRFTIALVLLWLASGITMAADGPDLVITDFWEQNHQVQFRIANAGDVTCGSGHTVGLKFDGTFTDSVTITGKMLPGTSVVGTFPKLYWQCTQDGEHTLNVIADYYSAIQESNEKNNNREEIWVCDSTPPKITSGPTAVNITTTSAVIQWQTDEDSDSLVQYGTKSGNYTDQASSSTMTTTHQVQLKNLTPNKIYYYIVASSDASGNTVQSTQQSFQTDQALWPDLKVDDVWESNGTVTARIKNDGDAAAAAGHSVALYVDNQFADSAYIPDTLAPGAHVDAIFQQYQWQCTQPERQVMAVADIQNVVDESNEDNNSWTSVWTCDLTAPTIKTGPEAIDITTSQATIVWTTDEPSDSVVWYGTESNAYVGQQTSSALMTSHSMALSWLDPNTQYFYFVQSTDDNGNTVSSGEHCFETLPEQTGRPDLIVAKMWRSDHAVHYEIVNVGAAEAAAGHLAVLCMDGDEYDSNRIEVALAPGASVEGRFPKFYFQCMDTEHVLEITADAEDVVTESDESNNDAEETVACDVELFIVSGPEVQEVGSTTATIVWRTNLTADSGVEYDSNAKGFSLRHEDDTLVETHQVQLSQLVPGTVYQYRVLSRTPGDQKVMSRAAYFKTSERGGNLAPVVRSVTMERQPTKPLYYKMMADVEDDMGIAYVSFFLDDELIGTDYSEPYECPVLPAALALDRERFLQGAHRIEAVAVDTAMVSAGLPGLFEPAYECAAVTAEFREPYPGDTLYIEGSTVPDDTFVPIRIFAAELDWNCHVSHLGGMHGEHPMICEEGYAELQEVRFYVNTVPIDTVTPMPWTAFSHVYGTEWDVSGYPVGTYHIRVDAVANDECIQTIYRDFRIETGEPRLELTRYVTRHQNYFHVELRVRNRGTVPFYCDRIVDNVQGLQPIAKFETGLEVTPIRDNDTSRYYEVDLNLHTRTGVLYTEIPAYSSLTVDYLAVPVQVAVPTDPAHAIGVDPVRVAGSLGSDDWAFDRPCVLTEADIPFADEVHTAISGSDYMVVTNPVRLVSEFGSSSDVLCAMAEFAIERNAILGYVWGTDWDDPEFVRDTCLRTWGASMDGGDYLSGGYLLLVGETEILPAWPVPVSDRHWSSGERTTEVGLADLPYADLSGADSRPELAVGRIIGNSAGELIGSMMAGLGGGFDRSYGVVTTGYNKSGDNFVARAWEIDDVWDDQAAAGLCMGDGSSLHHWSAYVQKEELVSGYDFPMGSGNGFLLVNLSGTGVEAVRFDRYQAHVASHSTLDLIETEFYREFYCDFESGDALACGDLDNDGVEEVVVGSMSDDQIVIYDDLGHGTPEFLLVSLSGWDVVVCGDVWGDAREEILVARRTDGGQVSIYSYDNSGTPSLSLVRTMDIPFTAWDGFAVGNVDTGTAGNEIIVGRDDNDRIYVYDSSGTAIADFPCDPYTGYDAMAVGDLDGDGVDEIAVVIDDDVHGKRTLKIFQNDCWQADPAGGWSLIGNRNSTIYTTFLHFSGARTTGSESRGDIVVAADIDGDGKDELGLANSGHDRLYILDGHYTRGWKDRYLPVLQAVATDIDVFTLCGHGSPVSCSPLSRADVGTLSLSSSPVTYALSCLTGNYEGDWWWYNSDGRREDNHDGDDGYAEAFFGSGAAVYIGSTEVSPCTMNNAAGPALLGAWDPDETIGQAFRDYKRTKADDGGWWRFWVTEYNLYGDPKFGAVEDSALAGMVTIASADESVGAEPAADATTIAPTSITDGVLYIDVNVPDYEVQRTGELDYVTIPDGDLVFEQGRPQVPYYVVTQDVPAGTVVQNVELVERGGLQTADGLVLPLVNCTPDLDGYEVTPAVPTFAGWFPTKPYDWNVVMNADGSSTLQVRLYPFFYNSVTTAAQFCRQFSLAVETVESPVLISWLETDKSVYQVGETVSVGLGLDSAGDPVDVVMDAVVRRYGTDERLGGLLLKQLDALMGNAMFTPQWDSADVEPGRCYIDVTIADMTGRILDRETVMIRLDN